MYISISFTSITHELRLRLLKLNIHKPKTNQFSRLNSEPKNKAFPPFSDRFFPNISTERGRSDTILIGRLLVAHPGATPRKVHPYPP